MEVEFWTVYLSSAFVIYNTQCRTKWSHVYYRDQHMRFYFYKNPFCFDAEEKEPEPNPFYCEPCDVSCNSGQTFNSHVSSSKHKRKCSPDASRFVVAKLFHYLFLQIQNYSVLEWQDALLFFPIDSSMLHGNRKHVKQNNIFVY